MNVADHMLIALADRYGVTSIGDGYMQWVNEFGPEWDDIVDHVTSETGVSNFQDAWSAYWANGINV